MRAACCKTFTGRPGWLGNIIAAQIWEKAWQAIPDLCEQFERSEFTVLRESLHRHGRKFTPAETLEKVVGGPIDVGPYVRYLQGKLGEVSVYRLWQSWLSPRLAG